MATSPDTTNYYKGVPVPGLGSVGQYQSAGQPYITGSTVAGASENTYAFPNVTKNVTVRNLDATSQTLYVHFASVSTTTDVISNKHYITLDSTRPEVTLNVRCPAVYISAPGGDAKAEVYAELTSIVPPNGFSYNVLNYPGVSD